VSFVHDDVAPVIVREVRAVPDDHIIGHQHNWELGCILLAGFWCLGLNLHFLLVVVRFDDHRRFSWTAAPPTCFDIVIDFFSRFGLCRSTRLTLRVALFFCPERARMVPGRAITVRCNSARLAGVPWYMQTGICS